MPTPQLSTFDQLRTFIATNFPDNNSGLVDPEDVRVALRSFVDIQSLKNDLITANLSPDQSAAWNALIAKLEQIQIGNNLGLIKLTDTPPATGKYRGDVATAGTYTNFKDITDTALDFTQLEIDENFCYIYVVDNVSTKIITGKSFNIADESITTKKTNFVISKIEPSGKNILNPDNLKSGYMVYEGALYQTVPFNSFWLLPIIPNTEYSFDDIYDVAWYDSNQNLISYRTASTVITSPPNARFLSVDYDNSALPVKKPIVQHGAFYPPIYEPFIAKSIIKIEGLEVDGYYKKQEADSRYASKGTTGILQSFADNRYAYKSDSSYTKAQSDSKYTPIGSVTASGYQFINAANFDFLPTKTASENVIALQNVLNGGGKTIVISLPGTYQLNSDVYIDDDTELIIGKGVYFKKVANYCSVLINRGALTRTYNKNITIKGLKIIVDGKEGQYPKNSPLYGVRGNVNFYWCNNIRIYDYEVLDIGYLNWGLSFNRFDGLIIDGLNLAGHKDGINIGNGQNFVIKNYESSCYDDTIGLNAHGYHVSTPEVGTLKNGAIENLIYTNNPIWGEGGRVFNCQLGSVVNWQLNIEIVNGDTVNANGNTYFAIVEGAEPMIISTTAPSIESFNDTEKTSDGIEWRLMKLNETTGLVNVENITFKNIVHKSLIEGILMTLFSGEDIPYTRSVHPLVDVSDFPEARNIKFDGINGEHCFFNNGRTKLGATIEITNWTNRKGDDSSYFIQSLATEKPLIFNIHDCDFSQTQSRIKTNYNSELTINNNRIIGSIGVVMKGRLNGNTSVQEVTTVDLTKSIKGDEINLLGVKKIYNGTSWIDLN